MSRREDPRGPAGDAGRDRRAAERRRQYELDAITARYAEEYRAGHSPRLDDYQRAHPEFAAELAEFVLYFHTVGEDLPAPGAAAVPAAALSPGARAAREAILWEVSAAEGTAEALAGLVARGIELGLQPPALAEAMGLDVPLLGQLEARVIAAATIPRALVERMASALRVAPGAVAAYLGAGSPAAAAGFFYAERAPETQGQQSFLDAVRGSALPPETKRAWEDAVRDETRGA